MSTKHRVWDVSRLPLAQREVRCEAVVLALDLGESACDGIVQLLKVSPILWPKMDSRAATLLREVPDIIEHQSKGGDAGELCLQSGDGVGNVGLGNEREEKVDMRHPAAKCPIVYASNDIDFLCVVALNNESESSTRVHLPNETRMPFE